MNNAKLRRQKKRAKKKGLLWSADKSVRSAAWKAGFKAITLDSEPMALSDFFDEGFNLDTIASFLPSKEERESTFREAWNTVILESQKPKVTIGSTPRKNVFEEVTQGSSPKPFGQPGVPKQKMPLWIYGIPVALFLLWRK